MTITARRVSAHSEAYAGLAGILDGPHWPDAACRRYPAHLWDDRRDLPPDGEPPTERAVRLRGARAICRICPRLAECLARRLGDNTLGGGMWGGELFTGTGGKPTEITTAATGDCGWCGEEIAPSRRRKYGRTCSSACRRAIAAKRAQEAPEGTYGRNLPGLTHCQRPACGRELTEIQRKRRARNCSPACRETARQERVRAARTTTEVAA